MEFTIDPYQREVIQREFIGALKAAGLVVVPKEISAYAVEFEKRKRDLLKKRTITPYNLEKYNVLGKSRKTIMNMIASGKIRSTECYKDEKGKTQILTIAVKRLLNE